MVPFPLQAWRKRKLKRRFPDGKVSAHFRHIEFWTHDGTPIPASDANLSGLHRHCQLVLEPMRKKFGPCHVLSGYRHRSYNTSIGGAPGSHHIWEEHRDTPATDLTFAQGTPEQWADHADLLMRTYQIGGGIGTYRRMNFLHVDLRSARARWNGKGE